MKEFIDNILDWLKEYPALYDNLKFIGVFGLALLSYFVIKYAIGKVVRKITSRTKTDLDDLVLNQKLIRRVALIAPVFAFYYCP